MAKEKRYKNRNTPAYQEAYNNGKGRPIIIRANKLRRELQKRDGLKKNPPGMQAAHYKGSCSKGRPQHRSKNRRSRLKINGKKTKR